MAGLSYQGTDQTCLIAEIKIWKLICWAWASLGIRFDSAASDVWFRQGTPIWTGHVWSSNPLCFMVNFQLCSATLEAPGPYTFCWRSSRVFLRASSQEPPRRRGLNQKYVVQNMKMQQTSHQWQQNILNILYDSTKYFTHMYTGLRWLLHYWFMEPAAFIFTALGLRTNIIIFHL